MTQTPYGTLYGVGVGPGDPELMTLKAHRLIHEADVISYIGISGGDSQARHIAAHSIATAPKPLVEIAVPITMSTDRSLANAAYDTAATHIRESLEKGLNVVFLCEGDPLFFGSFTYILDRLGDDYPCQVVPGISSLHSASAALLKPLTLLKESFAVISGRHSDEHIRNTLLNHDTVVIMKAGRSRSRLLGILQETNRSTDAHYLEYISRDEEKIVHDVSTLPHTIGPYFSVFVVIRRQRDRS
ncbi:MAG: precorrin-2 C(20)-methyltransferase [Proteobacteria bacterium]|nr:MAG: precorrin-2 C(20)-methyltransferase [Pseudomonadota bacterium]